MDDIKLDLTDVGNVFSAYQEALVISVQLPDKAKGYLLKSAASYLAKGCLIEPRESRFSAFHEAKYGEAETALEDMADSNGQNAAVEIVTLVDKVVTKGGSKYFDAGAKNVLLQQLIEESKRFVKEQAEEIASSLSKMDITPDISELDKYMKKIPPTLCSSTFSEENESIQILIKLYNQLINEGSSQ